MKALTLSVVLSVILSFPAFSAEIPDTYSSKIASLKYAGILYLHINS